jgi:hypothetical protein
MTLLDMLQSKKFIAALVALLVALGAKAGLKLDTDLVMMLVSPLWLYILGQGIADHGKEAAAQHSETATTIAGALSGVLARDKAPEPLPSSFEEQKL